MAIKIGIDNGKVKLSLFKSMGGIRIADEHGNHVSSPTKQKNEVRSFVEWMITNEEIKFLVDSFFEKENINNLTSDMNDIKKFTEESEYSKRKTIKLDKEKVENFDGFEIFQYTENFSSFEKILDSKIKVRITFKLGDYGLEPHPHMYVLLSFSHPSIKLKNNNGVVNQNGILGSGCFAEWIPTNQDIKEIITTLAHASSKHRDALVKILIN